MKKKNEENKLGLSEEALDTLSENKKHFKFRVLKNEKKSRARAGIISTPHGEIPTPVFMPVGTHGAVKAQTPQSLTDMDIPIILSNTYHLMLAPGDQIVKRAGGLHQFMNWHRNILTDSGGFQVFSLPNKKITERGVEFGPDKKLMEGASFKDRQKKKILLSPERAIEVQQALGSDIMMAFDECLPYPCDYERAAESLERTSRWLKRCMVRWTNPKQSLFGIVQGSTYDKLRRKAAAELKKLDLPGYAIGGVSVGEGQELMQKVVRFTAPLLPAHKPKYVMGVGTPEDLLILWKNGVDMSDCIIPTKYARNGTLFTHVGKIRITNNNYRKDLFPPDTACSCYTCSNFSRSYLYHLFHSNEILGAILATTHNLAFYKKFADDARAAILEGRYERFAQNYLDASKR